MDPVKAPGFDHVVDLNLNDNLLSIPMRSCIAQFSGPSSLFGMRPNCSHSRLFALIIRGFIFLPSCFLLVYCCHPPVFLVRFLCLSDLIIPGMSLVISVQKASVLMLPGR